MSYHRRRHGATRPSVAVLQIGWRRCCCRNLLRASALTKDVLADASSAGQVESDGAAPTGLQTQTLGGLSAIAIVAPGPRSGLMRDTSSCNCLSECCLVCPVCTGQAG